MPPSPDQQQNGSVGPLISVIIILGLMLIGAVYFWNVQQARVNDTVPYITGGSSTTPTQ